VVHSLIFLQLQELAISALGLAWTPVQWVVELVVLVLHLSHQRPAFQEMAQCHRGRRLRGFCRLNRQFLCLGIDLFPAPVCFLLLFIYMLKV
jgi:hypothetical protein